MKIDFDCSCGEPLEAEINGTPIDEGNFNGHPDTWYEPFGGETELEEGILCPNCGKLHEEMTKEMEDKFWKQAKNYDEQEPDYDDNF